MQKEKKKVRISEEEKDALLRAEGRRIAKAAIYSAVQRRRREKEWSILKHILVAVGTVAIAVVLGFLAIYFHDFDPKVPTTYDMCTQIATSKSWEEVVQRPNIMVSVPVEKLCKKLGIPEVVCEDPPPDAKGLLWPVEKYIEYYPEACWEAILVLMCQSFRENREVGVRLGQIWRVPRYGRYC